MNEAVQVVPYAGAVERSERALTAIEHRAQVNLIQQVMKEVMEEGVHYGKVPGTDKPSLWKPGAEKLSMTFHIAVNPEIDADLSTDDVRRYRIRAQATSQSSGAFLGSALGACSSDEEKYKWRAAVCNEEFEETPVDRRRKKWKKGSNGAYAVAQVRTEPADIDNTVLKMAVKRAVVAVILQVTAASDIFTQDVEDLPDEVRDEMAEKKNAAAQQSSPTRSAGKVISENQAKRFFAICKGSNMGQDQVKALLKQYGFETDRDITVEKYDEIVKKAQDHGHQNPPA